jgi:putative ABC transport system substrate-binding protein
MDRRGFVSNLAGGLLAFPAAAYAQPASKVYRIGWLREGAIPVSQNFWSAMREMGWVEGKNVTVEPRFAGTADELPALAKELARLNVDLILTDGTRAARAAKAATETIPIVFALGSDPVQQQLVASLARPGANLTGFTFGYYEDKQLQVIKEAVPRISRVTYPVQELDPRIVQAASVLGVRVQAIPVRGPDHLASFFASVRSTGADSVVFPNLAWAGPHEKTIAAEAIKVRVPLIGTWRSIAVFGALLSYGPNLTSYWARLAAQVDKIFKGAKASDLPVELPTTFDLVINLQTAKVLGLTIPQSLLFRGEVI